MNLSRSFSWENWFLIYPRQYFFESFVIYITLSKPVLGMSKTTTKASITILDTGLHGEAHIHQRQIRGTFCLDGHFSWSHDVLFASNYFRNRRAVVFMKPTIGRNFLAYFSFPLCVCVCASVLAHVCFSSRSGCKSHLIYTEKFENMSVT